MPGSVEVIDLTEEALESVDSANTVARPPRKGSYEDYAAKAAASRVSHRKFWERVRSGPQQHGPRRVRNLAAPRLGDVCPFLELPAEIRNRIYEYALGGYNLHLFARNYTSYPDWPVTRYIYDNTELQTRESYHFQYSICQCPDSDRETYERSAATEEVIRAATRAEVGANGPRKSFQVRRYQTRHAACLNVSQWFHRKVPFRERPVRLSMALLRTCKQVHEEACLVPYYDNTFSFASGKDLDIFVNAALQPKQRAVIQHLQYTRDSRTYLSRNEPEPGLALGFDSNEEWKYADSRILCGLQLSTVDMLVGLQSLDVALDNYSYSGAFDAHLPRFLKQGLTIRVVVRDGWNGFGRDRAAAVKLEFGLSRSTTDVADEHEATMQLRAVHGKLFFHDML